MRRVMMILILIVATAVLTGCHDGYYSGGFGYGYSSDVLVCGGHHGYYGHYGYPYYPHHYGSGHHYRHGHHDGHGRH